MEDKEWFLYVVDHHEGPLTTDEIKTRLKIGEANPTSYVWKEGYADWVMMSDLTEFGPGGPKSDGHGPATISTFISNDLEGVPVSASVWCLNSKKIFSGPHSQKTIVRRINEGDVLVTDSVWREGWTSFVTITNIPGFMQSVKTNVLHGDRIAKKKEVSKSAAAIGLSGASVRTYRWYKSTKFAFVLLLSLVVGLYQAISTGRLDFVLEKTGMKNKIRSLSLAPVFFDRGLEAVMSAKNAAMPLLLQGIAFLPEPAQRYLSPIAIPENVSRSDADALKAAALGDLKDGARVASALSGGEDLNPVFVISSNLPNGAVFSVVLKGKQETLLNAISYEKALTVDLSDHIAETLRFTHQGDKPLPKGEYALIVYEAEKQPPAVAAALSSVPKRPGVASVPPGKAAFVVDSYFLGGKKDATYLARVKEFNDRVSSRRTEEVSELRQLALTVENMANDSASRFSALAGMAPPRRLANWNQYKNKYAKLSAQIRGGIEKNSGVNAGETTLPEIRRNLAQTYELTERLHRTQTDVVENAGRPESVNAAAVEAAKAIDELKKSIFKVVL